MPHHVVCKRFNIPNPFPESTFVGTYQDQASAPMPSPVAGKSSSVQQPPKKSLFENLDFTKPPPGLYPIASTPTLPESERAVEHSVDDESDFPAPPISGIVTTTEPITKPPLDLFKEIFADTSESEEEVDDLQQTSVTKSPQSMKQLQTASKAPSVPETSDNAFPVKSSLIYRCRQTISLELELVLRTSHWQKRNCYHPPQVPKIEYLIGLIWMP